MLKIFSKSYWTPKAFFPTRQGEGSLIYDWTYSGEKNPGEMGVIKRYHPDYVALRNRSWQTFMDSDISRGVINKFCRWVIGSGLKLQAQPVAHIINQSKYNVDLKKFTKDVEAKFRLFCDSKFSVYNEEMTLHQYSYEAFKNALMGDVLVTLFYKNGRFYVQCIDGDHLKTPSNTAEIGKAERRGNTIRYGVEIDKYQKHIAYYVYKGFNKYQRIKARDSNGMRVAYLVKGMNFRLDSTRGIGVMSAGLESIKKLDRYKEAAIGSAEERAKIAWTVQHELGGSGEDPLISNAKSSVGRSANIEGSPNDAYSNGEKSASKIAETIQKSVTNLPPGSKLAAVDSEMEMNYSDFLFSNLQIFCASVDVPFEVVLSKFDSNYSASRAAIKDWEHKIHMERSRFCSDFFAPIYKYWLLIQDGTMNIKVPGLWESHWSKNYYLFEAFTKCRFIGPNVPHIDPVKEAKAIRTRLGSTADNIPLITMEQATEEMNGGDYEENIEKYSEELKIADKILPEEPKEEIPKND